VKARITLCGAGGTGKTTMMRRIAERYDLPVLPSIARRVQREMGAEREDDQRRWAPFRQWKFEQRLTDEWSRLLMETNSYVADRSMIDRYAYALYKLRDPDLLTLDELERYEDLIDRTVQHADLVIYCPLGVFDPPPDGFRTARENERRAVDAIIAGVWQRMQLFGKRRNMLPLTVGRPKSDDPEDVERALRLRDEHVDRALQSVGLVDGKANPLRREGRGVRSPSRVN